MIKEKEIEDDLRRNIREQEFERDFGENFGTQEYNEMKLEGLKSELRGFLAGQNSQKEKDLEIIEETKKRLGKLLIDNSKCYCREWTDKYRGISDVVFKELTQKIKGDEE